ncbi:A-kinase anchoring protein 7 isoform X2 [Eublepharis macularius]|uniref:A-kinase anchoring protein 7 isoform X2 n=1 Tax=Eublepharis macularius TaxID=481883 RepID=A0AA97J8Q9_EUBMA|nr:A-kinase anchoring protein 7 isoform X2 [Eublepharis macularius]
MVPRVLRALRFLVGTAATRSQRVARCSTATRSPHGIKATMAVRECPARDWESHRLGAEEAAGGESGGSGEPSSYASQLQMDSDGCHSMEQKKKQSKKQKKELCSLDGSIRCLMMEMPFAKADIENEFNDNCALHSNIKKKRKRTTGTENEGENLIKKKKKKQDRPNYFISLPITNPKIMDGIKALQNTIIKKDCRLSKAMVHHGSLHVTLLVMHLSSEEVIDKAIGAFLESKNLIEELLQEKRLDVSFQGIDHFRNQVGFVKLADGDHEATLLKIAEIVKKVFQEKGILTGDDKALKPHLTFMKLSKSPKLRKQGVKTIDPALYDSFKSHYFGDELLNRLDLCSMMKKKQPNGYYHCESSITVGKSHEANVVKEALHKEQLALLSKLNQIKALLSSPEIRMKMYKELLVTGLSGSIWENYSSAASSLT